MNEPIVSPLIIYLIGLSGEIQGWLNWAGAILLIWGGVKTLALLMKDLSDCEKLENTKQNARVWPKMAGVALGLFLAGSMIPSSSTATAMLVSSQATPANYEKVKTEILDLIRQAREVSQ